MKIFISALAIIASLAVYSPAAHAGTCDHSWQTASDGSNCGGRSADSRPGGRP